MSPIQRVNHKVYSLNGGTGANVPFTFQYGMFSLPQGTHGLVSISHSFREDQLEKGCPGYAQTTELVTYREPSPIRQLTATGTADLDREETSEYFSEVYRWPHEDDVALHKASPGQVRSFAGIVSSQLAVLTGVKPKGGSRVGTKHG